MRSYSFSTDRVKGLFLLSASIMLPHAAFSQGFTGPMGIGQAKTVGIKQLLPATVNLNQKHIKIEATAAIKTNGELVTILETKLVTFIQKDPRFIVDPKNPQTILKFTVTNSYIEERHYTVGTGNQTQNCAGFTGKLEVSYQALDSSNQAPLDSENLVAAIVENDHKSSGKFPGWPPLKIPGSGTPGACGTQAKSTMHEAQDELVDGIVHQMAQRAAPTDEMITVKLPGKKLDTLSRLALAQRWGTLEEEATKAEKLPKPEDDAYRLYLVALAKEAQAYDLAREASERENGHRPDISQAQADASFKNAMNLIDEARKLYKDALQAKPGEKDFQEPDNRMEKAVTVYATIARHKAEYEKAVALGQAKPAASPKSTVASTGEPVVTKPSSSTAGATSPLDQVLDYCKQNVAFETITDYIGDPSFLADAKASNYKFNFKTDTLAINANCKDHAAAIQRQMRDRLTGTPVHRAGTGSK